MQQFSKIEETIEDTVEHLKRYVNTKIDRAKLSAAEKASDVASMILAKGIIAFILLVAILMVSDSLAYGLGEWLGKTWLGFLIVAGIYLLLALWVWAARERLLRIPILNALLGRLFSEKSDEDEEV